MSVAFEMLKSSGSPKCVNTMAGLTTMQPDERSATMADAILRCPRCGTDKPASLFSKVARDIAYVAANREKVAAMRRAYQIAHPEDCLRRANESRQRNLPTYRARESAYREQNRAACNARIKEWKCNNPHAIVAYAGRRRAAELQAIPLWADLDAIAAIYRQAQARGPGHHVDHAVPLISKNVCGLHCEANMQILTASENARKNNRHWPDMWM